jgi:hypothetical protein
MSAPFRRVVTHRGADDKLVCGHTVPAHGLVASKRRCKRCAQALQKGASK